MEEQTPITNNRRAALKALAAAAGAATLAAIPARWSKPAVMVGAIPAHAQTSCVEFALIFDITATEETGTGTFNLSWDSSPAPDSQADGNAYWNCLGGCVVLAISNGGLAGSTLTPVITLFGSPLATPTLNREEDFWLAVNRATLAWDAASFPGGIDWNGIECAEPTV